MFSLTLTSFIWLNRCQMWYQNKVRRRTFSIVPYLRHLSNSSAQWLATVGCCQVMSGHSQPVVPKKMRTSLPRELNSNSTYEHTYKHKNLAEMFPCSTHGMCIRIHQTQRMVQVPFNVLMAAKPLNAILQRNGLQTTLNFITRSRANTESLSLANICSHNTAWKWFRCSIGKSCRMTRLSQTWLETNGKRKKCLFRYINTNITKCWMQAKGYLSYQPVTEICGLVKFC